MNPKDSKQETEHQATEESVLTQEERDRLNRRRRWPWVSPLIWTDHMLAALENGVKGGKWFSLIDKTWQDRTLSRAWRSVCENRGAAGVDKISIERFLSNAEIYLTELKEELQKGTYQPAPVRRVYIPKGKGKRRPLGIPTVKDRIAQTAVKMVIEPILEKEFLDVSYGFRPQKGCKDALRQVDKLLTEGYHWVVDADLQSYFDTIPHDRLIMKIRHYISDGRMIKLIEKWLHQEIMEEGKTWIPTGGTPQGAVLSPLLANLYLHDMDELVTANGHQMVRYADDFVILCRTEEEAKEALELVKQWVQENGLTIHPEKSHLGNYMEPGQGFEFLGYRFENGKRDVRQKSLMSLRERIRSKTRRTCGQSIEEVIASLNPMLAGWYAYFKHVNKWGLGHVDAFVRRRLRAILRKQMKRPGRGRTLSDHRKWPNAYFAKLGLFTMEQQRRVEACQSR